MELNLSFIFAFIIFLSCLYDVDATLSKSDKKDKKAKKQQSANVEEVKNVVERKLIQRKLRPFDILKDHDRYCEMEKEMKHFDGEVLAYVTPWNSKGYDIAKIFHKKFTLVSPVWLQLKPKHGKCVVTGTHDVDEKWGAEVTRGGENKLVPRVLFEGWSLQDYTQLFGSEDKMNKCAKVLTSYITGQQFGGVTLEIWSQIAHIKELIQELPHFLIHLADQIHAAGKTVVLVVPPGNINPSSSAGAFTKENFEELKDSIDYFNVMTYDYQNQVGFGAPLSPLSWVEKSITDLSPIDKSGERGKILMGLNFYGIKYGDSFGGQPIINHEFLQILKSYSPQIEWGEKESEHRFLFEDGSTASKMLAYYPTLYSINERLKLARKLGTGIAIWEIGQGLNYFYDLL